MTKWEISNVAFCATTTYLLFLFSAVLSAEKKAVAPAAVESLDEQRRPARQYGIGPFLPTYPGSIGPWLPTGPGSTRPRPLLPVGWLPTGPTRPTVLLPPGWLPTGPIRPMPLLPINQPWVQSRPMNTWPIRPVKLPVPPIRPKLPPGVSMYSYGGGYGGGMTVDEACDLLCPDDDYGDYSLWRAPGPTKGRFVPIRG